MDLKELLAKPHQLQRHYMATILAQANSCIVFNAVKTHQQLHTAVFDVPRLRQLRHLIDIETALEYHNRSEPVTQRINSRSDSVEVWSKIYDQYIPSIAQLVIDGNIAQASASLMAMLAEVESQY